MAAVAMGLMSVCVCVCVCVCAVGFVTDVVVVVGD